MSQAQVYSLVEYYGLQAVPHCGYCKTRKGHRDYGMWLHFLTVMDYQNLIDRGWRRSGSYGYKPVMKEACCALYTIRCGALDLRLTRSQKKIIKRFNRFIVHGERRKCRCGDEGARGSEETFVESTQPLKSVTQLKKFVIGTPESSCSFLKSINTSSEVSMTDNLIEDKSSTSNPKSRKQNKKKIIRFERAKKKIMTKGKTEEEAIEILKLKKKVPKSKTIEEFLREREKPNVKHKIDIKLVQSNPTSEEFKKTFDLEYEVYRKYQLIIHKDEPDSCTASQFRRFLVNSPLLLQPVGDRNAPVKNFGSYHQQYWLDGKLIAVGVIDILPRCVSSVYFFYDPDYNDLILGSYGTMIELQLVRELHKFVPSIQYYYMGFYIHTCPKMRYKARISPSYLLCPETYTFQPIDQCFDKITKYGVCRLHPDPGAKDECDEDSINGVMVLFDNSTMSYDDYRVCFRKTDQDIKVKEFVKVVGKTCVRSLMWNMG